MAAELALALALAELEARLQGLKLLLFEALEVRAEWRGEEVAAPELNVLSSQDMLTLWPAGLAFSWPRPWSMHAVVPFDFCMPQMQ
jgi:hypothetical protein